MFSCNSKKRMSPKKWILRIKQKSSCMILTVTCGIYAKAFIYEIRSSFHDQDNFPIGRYIFNVAYREYESYIARPRTTECKADQ